MAINRIITACLTCFTAVAFFVLITPPTHGADTSTKFTPNIAIIVADDQAYHNFGFMGDERVHTPNLDALAARSARFTHGYVPSSVCRPSLVSILTGLYPHRHGVHFNHPPPGFAELTKSPSNTKHQYDLLRRKTDRFVRSVPTIPRILGEHRYRSLQTGKFWEGHYTNAGFSEGMTNGEPSGGLYGDKVLASGEVVAHGNGDHGLAIGRETMKPIEAFIAADTDQPFMIWYAPFLPHVPHDSPTRYFEIASSYPNVKAHELPYFAAIAQFDATVGELIELLQKHEKESETLIAFVSDNGWLPDEDRSLRPTARNVPSSKRQDLLDQWDHTFRSKRAPFDDGLRTPILIAWDGHVVPATHTSPVSSVDLLPTLLSAIGVEPSLETNQRFDGVDLWPVVTGENKADARRSVFGELYPGDATKLDDPSRDIAYRWIRQGDYKLIVPHTHGGKKPWKGFLTAPALYDIKNDPRETNNLLATPSSQERFRQIAQRLTLSLNQWWNP